MKQGAIDRVWNTSFLNQRLSNRPQNPIGIGAAIQLSLLMMFIVILLSLPMGVAAAIYLEFFAPRKGVWGWLTTVVEININNLASVPSIVFGLMGLAIFVNLWGPIFIFDTGLATPIVGGLILSLMTLPTIVVTSELRFLAFRPLSNKPLTGLAQRRCRRFSDLSCLMLFLGL